MTFITASQLCPQAPQLCNTPAQLAGTRKAQTIRHHRPLPGIPHPQGAPVASSVRPQGWGVASGLRPQSTPAGGVHGGAARGGALAARPKQAYNQMAPPTNQYTADLAMAVAQNVVSSSRAMPTPVTSAPLPYAYPSPTSNLWPCSFRQSSLSGSNTWRVWSPAPLCSSAPQLCGLRRIPGIDLQGATK
jgi:hypothetical protein